MRQPSKTLLTAVFLWTLHYKTVINPHNMLWQQKITKMVYYMQTLFHLTTTNTLKNTSHLWFAITLTYVNTF